MGDDCYGMELWNIPGRLSCAAYRQQRQVFDQRSSKYLVKRVWRSVLIELGALRRFNICDRRNISYSGSTRATFLIDANANRRYVVAQTNWYHADRAL